jgi:outer membrane protein W
MIIPQLLAQGMTRSNGIGFRVNFWTITDRPTRIDYSAMTRETSVDISGAGGSLYFFTRIHNNLFFDLTFEAVASVQTVTKPDLTDSTHINLVIPILLGLHYDVLPSRLSSSVQPYITAGLGPYWVQKGRTNIEVVEPDVEGSIESEFIFGAYAGLGANILITDWLALNVDLKYHIVDFNFNQKYSGPDFGLGLSFMWGSKRELFQLQDIKVIVKDIYPAYYQFYNTYPIALVTVKNISGHPIEVNVRSEIDFYSERPAESGFTEIPAGEIMDIPVNAVFGPRLLKAGDNKPAILDIEIEGRAGQTEKKDFSTQIVIHSRNAWNGDMDKLVYFVTPDDDQIFNMNRTIVSNLEIDPNEDVESLKKAHAVFNNLRDKGITYHRDPNIAFYKDDRVQFAIETIRLGNGDCDDLVVLYASCLESLGIRTAFVEVKDPKQEIAHLYLLFDTGIPPEQGYRISTNEKRFVIRSGNSRFDTIWLPIETTVIDKGFEKAWETGALAYLEEGIMRNGISEGWVRVIDVNSGSM